MLSGLGFEEKAVMALGCVNLATLVGATLWRQAVAPPAPTRVGATARDLALRTGAVLVGMGLLGLWLVDLLERLGAPESVLARGYPASLAAPWALAAALLLIHRRERFNIGLDPAADPALDLITAAAAFPLIGAALFLGRNLPPAVWGSLALVAVTRGVAEELLFRGYWQGAAESVLGPRAGLWLGVGFYALIRVPPVLLQGLSLRDPMVVFHLGFYAAMGLVLGWIFRRTRSVGGLIALHIGAELMLLAGG